MRTLSCKHSNFKSHPSIVPFRAKKRRCITAFHIPSSTVKVVAKRHCYSANASLPFFFGFPTYTFERVTTDNKYAIFMSSSPLFRWLPLSIFFPWYNHVREYESREFSERAERTRKKFRNGSRSFYVSVFFLNFKTINGKSNKAKIMIGLKKKKQKENTIDYHSALFFKSCGQERKRE